MKSLVDLLLLGNPLLYKILEPVLESELTLIPEWITDLNNVMQEIRDKYHFGRAIAAPQ
jgi:peptide deformylase